MRRSFALTEVLVALAILALCIPSLIPYFHQMQIGYQSIHDRAMSRYLAGEYLAEFYARFCTNPPTFEEIEEGFSNTKQIDGFTIVELCARVDTKAKDDEPAPVCLAELKVGISKDGIPSIQESMRVCCQKTKSGQPTV